MNIISNRAPSNLLAVVRTNGLTKVSGCACNKDKRVVQLLIRIGMPYAAGMHIKNNSKEWVPQDWVPHIKEEDEELFPILKTVAFTLSNPFEKEQLLAHINQLIADHKDVIIPAIEANKLPSDEFAKKHGDLEDYLIRKYYYKILQVYNLASSDNSSFRIVGNKAGNIGIDQPTTVGVGISVDDLDLFKEKESSGLGLVLCAAIGGALMFVGAPILLAVAPLALVTTKAVYDKVTIDNNIGPDGNSLPRLTTGDIKLWTKNNGITQDKFSLFQGQKFIDPKANRGLIYGREYLVNSSNDATTRINLIENKILTTPVHDVPLLNVMRGLKIELGLNSFSSSISNQIDKQYKDNADKLREYGKKSGNPYAIAFSESVGWLWEHYDLFGKGGADLRKIALGEEAAESAQKSIAYTLMNLCPIPWHELEDKEEWTGDLLESMQRVNNWLTHNALYMEILPPTGRSFIKAWFTIFLANINDPVILKAANILQGDLWGRANWASDEQVYIVGLVLSRIAGLDEKQFITDLWNRSSGWSKYQGLLTNDFNPQVPLSQNFDSQGMYWRKLGKWVDESPHPETGEVRGAPVIQNAITVQWMDLCINGFALLAEKTGLSKVLIDGPESDGKVLKNIAKAFMASK